MRAVTAVATLGCLAIANAQSWYREGDAVCEQDGDSTACPVSDLTPSELDGSVLIYPGGETRCAFDDFYNESVSYATNQTYFFQVFPNTDGDRSKLFLYYQGGGACLDETTCSFGLQCIVQTFTPNATAFSTGIANRTDPNNMFRDWNLVHTPYCTGDLHVGNHTEMIPDNSLLSLLDTPDCLDRNMTIHQVGYTNTMAALDWAYENYPNPTHIVIGGSSAGSLGAQLLSVLVAEKWQVEANGISYSVLADSYVGVQPPDKPGSETIQYFGGCDVDLGLSETVKAGCDNTTLTTEALMEYMIATVPSAEWLFVNSEGDYTQRYYYQFVEDGILGYPFTDIISAEDFYGNLTEILETYTALSDKVSLFYATGIQHVFLTVNDFYHNATNDTTGEYLGSVINRWLTANESIDGTTASGSVAGSVSGSSTGSSSGSSVHQSLSLLFSAVLAALALALA